VVFPPLDSLTLKPAPVRVPESPASFGLGRGLALVKHLTMAREMQRKPRFLYRGFK
jgi:hypothetical protein